MSRNLFEANNPVQLNLADVSQQFTSDKLFVGKLAHKALIHSILLHIYIEGQGGNGGAPTIASLGNFSLHSTSDGKLFEIPLRLWATIAPNLAVPIYTLGGGGQDLFIEFTIPIPFALIQGLRGKDSYLVSEKCNDYYFQINGTPENGVDYICYTITPEIIAERTNYIALPSKAPLVFVQDTIPNTGQWYNSKLNITGASWLAFCKSDFANFVATESIALTIDGIEMQTYNNALRMNRVYAYTQQHRSHFMGLDTIPDNVLIFPLLWDSKAAKLTRSSLFEIKVRNPGQADFRLMAMYQPVQSLTANEAFALAKRQSPAFISEAEIASIRKVPVDAGGKLNPIQAKDLYAKIYKFDAKANDTVRVANSA